MVGRHVTAQWAWVSKEPGARGGGYQILATSGRDINFSQYVATYITGSPDSGVSPDSPQAPPWVTIGSFLANGMVLVSVAVLDPWRDRDYAGRAIWPQRFFLFRFDELAAAGVSYRTLWEAIRDINIPAADSAPLTLQVQSADVGDLVSAIELYGFERMAGIAAAQLEARIAVDDAELLQRLDRLALLDAATALLPYGFRANLSLSSSVDNTVAHPIRLVFAHFANRQTLISLRDPAVVPLTQFGRDYLNALRRKQRTSGTAAVVEHLWAARQPRSLERPEEAPAVLGELDFYRDYQRLLRERTAKRTEALEFFR
jgi:hypothetical protein